MADEITVNNWFNTTDIKVYQAAVDNNGKWSKMGDGTKLVGKESGKFQVKYQGFAITYYPTAGVEKDLGYCAACCVPYLYILDVFDIAAGNMPHGYYDSWRAAWNNNP